MLRIKLTPNNARYGCEVQHAIARGNSVDHLSSVTDIASFIIYPPQVKAVDLVAVCDQVLSDDATDQSF